MELKKVEKNMFDVFMGMGWENWTRIKVNKDDVTIISGQPLGKNTINILKERLCKYVR